MVPKSRPTRRTSGNSAAALPHSKGHTAHGAGEAGWRAARIPEHVGRRETHPECEDDGHERLDLRGAHGASSTVLTIKALRGGEGGTRPGLRPRPPLPPPP